MKNPLRKYCNKILYYSYIFKLGHIPSALSILPIVYKIQNISNPIVIGKSFGLQSWFINQSILSEYINNQSDKILSTQLFKKSNLNVLYCQQELGIASNIATGYSLSTYKHTYCILSDSDIFFSSTLSAIELSFKLKIPVSFIIDYNKIQLFNNKDIYPLIKKYNPYIFSINDFLNINIQSISYPNIILVHTIKGYGFKELESNPKFYHYKILSHQEYKDILNNPSF